MKKLLRPACLLFYVLMLLVFFFIGMYTALFLEAGKDQMLAGGAIVVGWGVLFSGIAFLSSFFIVYSVPHILIKRMNWLLLFLLLVLYSITHFRYVEREKEKARIKIEQSSKKETKPAPFSK